MISRFFVGRPIFAWVIAIVIMLAGIYAIVSLPIAQYPDVAPPSVSIDASYPGASAQTLESSVTQIIEQQLTGLDGLIYFSSTSSAAGTVSITATFEKGTDADIAQVQVQNKVQQALPRLPSQVQQQGVNVTKSNSDFLLIVGIYDETNRASNADISDFLVSTLQEPLGRVPGVGTTSVFGSQYAMRIWLDPFKLAGVNLQPGDVISAIQAQNTQVAAGQIGAQPSIPGQQLTATVTAKSRLQTPEQFRAIIVKTEASGSQVRLSDVARVELGNENYSIISRYNRHPASGIPIQLAPGGDALKTAELVKAKVAELAPGFPAGFKVAYPRDSTDFIKLSIEEVVKTLAEAIALVVLVMFVFLQNWRATLIPAIAVPVVLLGTFGVLALFGYSINTLTLFALVLSIGLLVDDAIVVVENVERLMEEEGLDPREATLKSMEEITGALIGIALVLAVVFLPMAFFGGSTGVIYRQFSITIISSMLLSVIVALVLTPALTATLLRKPEKEHAAGTGLWARFTRWFNGAFQRTRDAYDRGVERTLRLRIPVLLGYAAIAGLIVLAFMRLPQSFLPVEDQGSAILIYNLPAGAAVSRTEAVSREVEDYFIGQETKNLEGMFAVSGFQFGGAAQNVGLAFLVMKPWDQRSGKENGVPAITDRANMALSGVRDARIFALTPPAIQGLGQSNGFTLELLNTGGLSREDFKAKRDQLLGMAGQDPMLAGVRPSALEDTPQLAIDVDEAAAGALGLNQADVNQTISAAWGSVYVNDFVDRGRVKRVFVQGDAPYRSAPEDLTKWKVRSSNGQMAPFSAFSTTRWSVAPSALERFNGSPSFQLQGQAGPGYSSGAAMDKMEELVGKLGGGVSVAWSGLSYQEQLSSGQSAQLYAISLLVVFLMLAALYESWSVPVAVLLVIPLGVIGAVAAVAMRGLENDIYFQVGLLTTMGLAAKNAILIVEFAEAAVAEGKIAVEAAKEAARLRLRPILMTSLAFMFGVFPLVVATGAGAQSRLAIGTAVFGGMFTATVLAIFYVPFFYVLVRGLFHGKAKPQGVAA